MDFIEYTWDRAEEKFLTACEASGIDGRAYIVNELWGMFKKKQIPEAPPVSDRGMKKFDKNVKYADEIAGLYREIAPNLIRAMYRKFSAMHPKHDQQKVRDFFNQFSIKLAKLVPQIIQNSKTTIDGESVPINDPVLRRRT